MNEVEDLMMEVSSLEEKVTLLTKQVERLQMIAEVAKWVASMDHPSPEAKAALRSAFDKQEEG